MHIREAHLILGSPYIRHAPPQVGGFHTTRFETESCLSPMCISYVVSRLRKSGLELSSVENTKQTGHANQSDRSSYVQTTKNAQVRNLEVDKLNIVKEKAQGKKEELEAKL
jgi:hypothetical protein